MLAHHSSVSLITIKNVNSHYFLMYNVLVNCF